MVCKKCGTKIPNGALTCPNCEYANSIASNETTVKESPNKKHLWLVATAVFVVIATLITAIVILSMANSAEKTIENYMDSIANCDAKAMLSLTMPFGEKYEKHSFTQDYFDEDEYLSNKYDSIEEYYSSLNSKCSDYYDGTIENADDAYDAYTAFLSSALKNRDNNIYYNAPYFDDYEIMRITEYDDNSDEFKKFVKEEWQPETEDEEFDFDREFYDQDVKGYAIAKVKYTTVDDQKGTYKFELFKLGKRWYIYG